MRDMIPADVPEHFRGTVSIWATVTTMDGAQQVASDDSTPVQKQLVDIQCSRVTRKQFKLGLSYVGMVSWGPASSGGRLRLQALCRLPPQLLPGGHRGTAAVGSQLQLGWARPAEPGVISGESWPHPLTLTPPTPHTPVPSGLPPVTQRVGVVCSHSAPLSPHFGTSLLSLCQNLSRHYPTLGDAAHEPLDFRGPAGAEAKVPCTWSEHV